MKIRTDLAGLALTALCLVAIVVLTLAGQPVPELLSTVTLAALTFAGGAAIPTTLGGRATITPPSGDVGDVLAQAAPSPAGPIPTPRGLLEAGSSTPAAPAPIPGRDMTETFPAITPAMIAAHKAGQP